jgi:hypothetical protein
MWILRGSRRVVLDTLGATDDDGKIAPKEIEGFPEDNLSKNEVILVWDTRPSVPSDLPSLAIVPQEEPRDFLAWTSTFFPGFLPFTAFVRVLDVRTARELWKHTRMRQSQVSNRQLRETQTYCVGLILGEVITQAPDMLDSSSLSPLVCASTLSFCMSKALLLQVLDDCGDRIVEKWSLARHLLDQPERKLSADAIRNIWSILAEVLNGDQFALRSRQLPAPSGIIVRASLELKTTRKIESSTWRELVGRELAGVPEKMQGPREERVSRFESAVSSLSHDARINLGTASFVCGYLASLIEPGSLAYAKLVAPHLGRFPTAMLWYGLCAGMERGNILLSQFSALGRRVMRDLQLTEGFLTTPNSDIAIEELEVFFEGDKPLHEFQRSSPRHISIEIFPGINTLLNWPDRTVREQPDYLDSEFLVQKIGQAIQSLNDVQRKLVSPKRHQPSVITRERPPLATNLPKERGKRRR